MSGSTSIFAIARRDGRDYVTPEDIGEAIRAGAGRDRLRRDVLKLLGRVAGFGCEDAGLCAFVAWKWKGQRRRKAARDDR